MCKFIKITGFLLFVLLITGCQPPIITERNVKNYDYIVAEAAHSYKISMSQLYEYIYKNNILVNGGTLDTSSVRELLDSILCDTLTGLDALDIRLEDYYDQLRLYKLRYYDFLIRTYFEETVYKKIDVDSQEVVDFYYSRPDLFSISEQINLYHILISPNGLLYGPDSLKYQNLSWEEVLRATEENVREVKSMINDPESFKNTARKYSHDTTTGRNGGYVGWTGRGVYVEPFDSVAFALQKGDISDPYQDDDGWHIIYIEDYYPQGVPPLNPDLYLSAVKSLRNDKTNKLGIKLIDSLNNNNVNVVYNESLMDSDIFNVDGRQWIAIVNNRDTIDCNEARSMELNTRTKYQVHNTTPEMKKEMLDIIVERYVIIQAARDIKIDTIPKVVRREKELRHKYAKIIINDTRYDTHWSPSDSLIEEYYYEHLDDFIVDKPLVVQHIIVQDSIFGEFLRDQAMSGIDFLELAEEHYPGEPGIRRDLANLGEIAEGDVPEPFYEIAKHIPVNEVSHPVKTEFGYHIIKVLEHRQSLGVREARHKIIPIIKKQHRNEVFSKYRDDIYSRYNVHFPGRLYKIHLKPYKLRKKS